MLLLLLLGGMRRYSGHFHVDAFRGARATFCSRAGVAVCRCCCGWSSMGHDDDDGKGEKEHKVDDGTLSCQVLLVVWMAL